MSNAKSKYTLLNRLLVFQIISITVVLGVICIGLYHHIKSGKLMELDRMKEVILPLLNERQDKWRVWKHLGLEEALNRDMDEMHTRFPNAKISVVSKNYLPASSHIENVILPNPSDQNAEFYVLAKLQLSELSLFSENTVVFLMSTLAFGVLSVITVLYSYTYLRKKIYRPLLQLNEAFESAQCGANLNVNHIVATQEIAHFVRATKVIIEREKEFQKIYVMKQVCMKVAHDIRSPLSSMKAALTLLREQCDGNRDVAESLNLLRLSSTRLDNIANGLLAKHKGDGDVCAQTFSIHEVLDELIGELRASPLGQGVQFVKSYSDSATYVTGDKIAIGRAFGNIIKNALEAMQQNAPDRAKQLIVSTILNTPSPQPSPTGGEGVSIRITDTGPGIAAGRIPLILQGGHTEGKSDGHGIGTKVLRDMVDAHKGTLAIESEIGVGTTFIVSLPATIQNEDTVVSIPISVGAKVIVIDDEPSLREQWRLTLKAQAVVPEIYSCWEEYAVSHEGRGIVDTFIVDYHFDNSEVDGLEIIRRLKEIGAMQFILATAEYWKPAIKEAAQKLNITLCPKPLPRVVVEQSPLPLGEGKPGPSVLLIDDDKGIQVSWKMMKQRWGVANLQIFARLEDMIAAGVDPSHIDLCVIDKNIPDSQYDGGQMLAYLKQNGARRVVLATGEREADIRQDAVYHAIDGILSSKVPETLHHYLT